MLAYIIGVVLFALGICVSVALHEAGHMVTAKAFGMKVRRYFVGFGPTVFSLRRGETEYGLKWIPLGGFCDIAGMTALDEVTPDEAPRAMWRFKTWKRTVVMSAGSVTHFILGFVVLYLMAVTMGLPNLNIADDHAGAVGDVLRPRGHDRGAGARTPTCPPGAARPGRSGRAAGRRQGPLGRRQAGRDLDGDARRRAGHQRPDASSTSSAATSSLALIVDVPKVQRWTRRRRQARSA